MKNQTLVRYVVAGSAALAMVAVGAKKADALYGPVYAANDRILNLGQSNNGSSPFSIGGTDTVGTSSGWAETSGSDGVKVYLTTQGGSGYVTGFVRCQSGSTIRAVYTGPDNTANGSGNAFHAWCSWLGAGWSRVGFGATMNTVDTNPSATDRRMDSGQGNGTYVTTKVHNPFINYYNPAYSPDWTSTAVMISAITTPSAPANCA